MEELDDLPDTLEDRDRALLVDLQGARGQAGRDPGLGGPRRARSRSSSGRARGGELWADPVVSSRPSASITPSSGPRRPRTGARSRARAPRSALLRPRPGSPTCGVMKTLSSSHSGWPSGSGSGSVTSSAAPAIEPDAQRLDERVGVDQRAARDVDQPRVLAHRRELARRRRGGACRRWRARRSRRDGRRPHLVEPVGGERGRGARHVAAAAGDRDHLGAERLPAARSARGRSRRPRRSPPSRPRARGRGGGLRRPTCGRARTRGSVLSPASISASACSATGRPNAPVAEVNVRPPSRRPDVIHCSTPADGSCTQRTESGSSGSFSGSPPSHTSPSAPSSGPVLAAASSTAARRSGRSSDGMWMTGGSAMDHGATRLAAVLAPRDA